MIYGCFATHETPLLTTSDDLINSMQQSGTLLSRHAVPNVRRLAPGGSPLSHSAT